MSDSSSSTSSREMAARTAAIVVAGGAGRRMGGSLPKQYRELAGEPVLLHALRAFLEHPRVDAVVVVLPPADAAAPPSWLSSLEVRVVAGGAERADSVWNGLAAVSADVGTVLIHDGARPLVSAAVIDRVLEAVGPGGAVAALPVTDTLKAEAPDGAIERTVDRSRLWQAQTPQGFPLELIREAHRRAREDGAVLTDDAAACERIGVRVRLVQGDPMNLKVTRDVDLAVADALLRIPTP